MTTIPDVKVNITADTSQAIAALNDLKAALPAVKAGWRTTEFWLVALTVLSSLTSLLFHRDLHLGGQEQAWAVLASGVASSVYAISRSHLKKPVSLAALRYDVGALRDPAKALYNEADAAAHLASAAPAAPAAPANLSL